jgi:hypothetical protein
MQTTESTRNLDACAFNYWVFKQKMDVKSDCFGSTPVNRNKEKSTTSRKLSSIAVTKNLSFA